jgi:L-ribulose-5-phosphate 3-epimerase
VAERTNLAEWTEICQKIRKAGFKHVEVWIALVERCLNDADRTAAFAKALRDNGLTPVAKACALHEKSASLCMGFGIRAVAGGFRGSSPELAAHLTRETGIAYNYENQPEKSVDEIRQQCRYGADGFAVAVDTGWLCTQGIEAPRAVRELGRLIRHVHLKDIRAAGEHYTVRLGTGVADIPGVVRELKAIGYEGVLSWEDEPEDRNPFDIAEPMREYIERLWNA